MPLSDEPTDTEETICRIIDIHEKCVSLFGRSVGRSVGRAVGRAGGYGCDY